MVIEFSPFFNFGGNIEKLFDDYFSPLSYSQRRRSYPPLNISEDDNLVYVECELPGIDVNDVDITFSDSTLTISGEVKKREGKFYRQERPFGVFQRVVNVNTAVDRDKIDASYKDGILSIKLPKTEDVKPKKIAITG